MRLLARPVAFGPVVPPKKRLDLFPFGVAAASITIQESETDKDEPNIVAQSGLRKAQIPKKGPWASFQKKELTEGSNTPGENILPAEDNVGIADPAESEYNDFAAKFKPQ